MADIFHQFEKNKMALSTQQLPAIHQIESNLLTQKAEVKEQPSVLKSHVDSKCHFNIKSTQKNDDSTPDPTKNPVCNRLTESNDKSSDQNNVKASGNEPNAETVPLPSIQSRIDHKRKQALAGGGKRRVDAQHAKGKISLSSCPTVPI